MLVVSSGLTSGSSWHSSWNAYLWPIWQELPRTCQLVLKGSIPKVSIPKGQVGAAKLLRFISEIPEHYFCTLDQPEHLCWLRYKERRISLLLMWETGCMKLKAAVFGDCIRSLPSSNHSSHPFHMWDVCTSFPHLHGLIPVWHQFDSRILLLESGPDMNR